MKLFTATFHDETNEVQTDYKAANWHEAVDHASRYLEELGDGWGLASLALESFEFESLTRLGHVVPADASHPEFGQ